MEFSKNLDYKGKLQDALRKENKTLEFEDRFSGPLHALKWSTNICFEDIIFKSDICSNKVDAHNNVCSKICQYLRIHKNINVPINNSYKTSLQNFLEKVNPFVEYKITKRGNDHIPEFNCIAIWTKIIFTSTKSHTKKIKAEQEVAKQILDFINERKNHKSSENSSIIYKEPNSEKVSLSQISLKSSNESGFDEIESLLGKIAIKNKEK